MRIQEYYESPIGEFRGNYFTHEDFMDAYAENNSGRFTYFSDWSGFNVPGNIVLEFFELFDDLNKKETALYRCVETIAEIHGDQFYLIGVVGQDQDTLNHELAHAFYYLDKEYKELMDAITSCWENRDEFYKGLETLGYDDSVFMDETQAYIATSTTPYLLDSMSFHRSCPKTYKKVFENKLFAINNCHHS